VTGKFLCTCGKQISDRVVVAVDERVRGAFVLEVNAMAYPGILFRGFQQIQLRTEGIEKGDLGVVAPSSGVLEAAVIWYKKFHFM